MLRLRPGRLVRVFLQAGKADLDNEYEHWWLANLQMAAALRYRRDDYRFEAGSGGHDGPPDGNP